MELTDSIDDALVDSTGQSVKEKTNKENDQHHHKETDNVILEPFPDDEFQRLPRGSEPQERGRRSSVDENFNSIKEQLANYVLDPSDVNKETGEKWGGKKGRKKKGRNKCR